jgi:CDP-diacylglycerol--glycerol-3-phosphate 3-phosphatidyltransferase
VNIANKISTFRILSVPFFVAAILYYSPQRSYMRFVALGIFILAALSDVADGYMARRSKQQSKAGLILDPLGDKLLLLSAFICLSVNTNLQPRFPLWVILIVISRDVIIILGAVTVHMVKQTINILPTKWGKLTTAFQVLAVISVLLQLNISPLFWWLAVIFTVISGAVYINRGFKVLYAQDAVRNSH